MVDIVRNLEAIVIVKVSPQLTDGGGICAYCTVVTLQGEWVRLYTPLKFLVDTKGMRRWSRIAFKCKSSEIDRRPESYDVDSDSIKIIGEWPLSKRLSFLSGLGTGQFDSVINNGKSLAIAWPSVPLFFLNRKTDEQFQREQQIYNIAIQNLHADDAGIIAKYKPCPYEFKYTYSQENEAYEGICNDWRINSVFAQLSHGFGEARALMRMIQLLGKEYPSKGVIFILESHPLSPKLWYISSIIKTGELYHVAGDALNIVT